VLLAVCTVSLAAACERSKTPVPGTVTASGPSSAAAGSTVAAPMTVWDSGIGALVATPSLETGAPTIFLGDTTAQGDLPVELFSHDARTINATLHISARVQGCAYARSGSVSSGDTPGTPLVWAFALSPGVAQPISVDGISDLSARDSSALAVRLRKIVGTLPDDSASAPFRGLPVVLRDAWQFDLPDAGTVAIAIATRTTNVESNPRAQLSVLIAEPDSAAATGGGWRLGYTRRDAGPEDRAEGTDLLAAFVLKNGHPAVAFVRDGDHGIQMEIVERMSPGVWRLRWTSAALPCTN
jgi:hypothetical protein